MTLADRQRRTLVRGAASARYLPTSSRSGHLIYVSGATLFGVPFDPQTLSIVGSAVPIVNDVLAEGTVGRGHFDVSRNGTLIYRKARRTAEVPVTVSWLGPGAREDLSPDDTGIVVLRPVDSPAAAKPDHVVVILQNFFDELRRRAPLAQ